MDEFAQREAEKYENPIPSREFIADFIDRREEVEPATHEHLCKEMALKDEESIEALRRRLIAMERDGQLVSNKKGAYRLIEDDELVKGRISAHREGFGFLIPDIDELEDVYLNAHQMRSVFDGDIVMVRITGVDSKNRSEGKIVRVVERHTKIVVGRIYKKGSKFVVLSSQKRIQLEVVVDERDLKGADEGQYVSVEITAQPTVKTPAKGKVVEILGNQDDPGLEIEVAIRSFEIPYIWPEDVLEQVQELPDEVVLTAKDKRVDLRELPLVTIDGEDAKDFDDAVFCEAKPSGGWRLYVAIADVSHYVEVNSALDLEAHNRGTSTYFPGRVVPMLPEKLSNGLCSLMPEVDRFCLVCEMTVSARGSVSGYKFYEGIMHSAARLTYTKVSAILEKPESDLGQQCRERYSDVVPHLESLYDMFKVLLQARAERGAIEFESTETQFVFGNDKKVDDIIPVHRNDAHRIIEECMLCANVSAAKFLEKHELDGLYRVHEGPKEEKLNNLRSFLGELGLSLPGGPKPTPKDYQSLLHSIQGRPDYHIIEVVMLRSLQQAVYTPDNNGHFGLGYKAYTHYTSPIRRYPDLLVHRAIRHVIRSRKETNHVERVPGAKVIAQKNIYPYDLETMLQFGEHCSLTERRAEEASRDVVSLLKCHYVKNHLGDEFTGVISSVTGFGFFVELDGLYAEGLVHVASLNGDYYHFDSVTHRLTGENTRVIYQLGDQVTVQVAKVDIDERKIDLILADGVKPIKASRRRREARKHEEQHHHKKAKRTTRVGSKVDEKFKAKSASADNDSSGENKSAKKKLIEEAIEAGKETPKRKKSVSKRKKGSISATKASAGKKKTKALKKEKSKKKQKARKANASAIQARKKARKEGKTSLKKI